MLATVPESPPPAASSVDPLASFEVDSACACRLVRFGRKKKRLVLQLLLQQCDLPAGDKLDADGRQPTERPLADCMLLSLVSVLGRTALCERELFGSTPGSLEGVD